MKPVGNKSLEPEKPVIQKQGSLPNRDNKGPKIAQPPAPKPLSNRTWSNLEKNNLSKRLRQLSPASLKGVLTIITV